MSSCNQDFRNKLLSSQNLFSMVESLLFPQMLQILTVSHSGKSMSSVLEIFL